MSSILDNPILALLPTARSARPWLSTPEVADELKRSGHEVNHVKTVNRRLAKLESQGLLLCEERGRGRTLFWQLKEGASGLNQGSMSFDEALALQILKQFSAHQLPEQTLNALKALFDAAQTRLQNHITDSERRYAKWSRKVAVVSGHFQLMRPRIKDDVFQRITDALFTERLLSIRHKSAQNDEKPWHHTVMPLGLVEAGNGVLYLVAKTRPKNKDFYPDPVPYRIDRMTSAQLLDEGFRYPPDFSLTAFVQEDRRMEFFTGDKTRVTLKMSAKAAQFWQEQPLSADQAIRNHADGSATLTATVVQSFRFREWLMAKADQIEVVSPKSLREEIKSSLARAWSLYQ